MQPEVRAFIAAHEDHPDVTKLILQAHQFPHIPVRSAVNQILAKRKAKAKLPGWYENPDIIYPSLLAMEQCSSERLARFKASIITGDSLLDLTGGAGVDTYYLSKVFGKVDYVEPQEQLLKIAQHNFSVFGVSNVQFHHSTAEAFLEKTASQVSCIYLDPDRRPSGIIKTTKIADYQPDVLNILKLLFEKTEKVLIKVSPMLEIAEALKQLSNIAQIYVLAVHNECKELLFLLDSSREGPPFVSTIHFLKDDVAQTLSFYQDEEAEKEVDYSLPLRYIYDPNVAIIKAKAFKTLAHLFSLKKLHANSHLFTSDTLVDDFPGRAFVCKAICKCKKKEVFTYLSEPKAHIAVKNFPLTVKEVRKTLGLEEGGNIYLFATTDLENKKRILITEKVSINA